MVVRPAARRLKTTQVSTKFDTTVVSEEVEDANRTQEKELNNTESVNKKLRRSTRIGKVPVRFTTNSLSRTPYMGEPTVHEALSSSYAPKWKDAMREELNILEGMSGCETVNRSKDIQILQSKFRLR